MGIRFFWFSCIISVSDEYFKRQRCKNWSLQESRLPVKDQNLDTGAKVVHAAPETSSYINTRSISKDGGISTFRSSVAMTNSKAETQ